MFKCIRKIVKNSLPPGFDNTPFDALAKKPLRSCISLSPLLYNIQVHQTEVTEVSILKSGQETRCTASSDVCEDKSCSQLSAVQAHGAELPYFLQILKKRARKLNTPP
jgi:hypothetical protein